MCRMLTCTPIPLSAFIARKSRSYENAAVWRWGDAIDQRFYADPFWIVASLHPLKELLRNMRSNTTTRASFSGIQRRITTLSSDLTQVLLRPAWRAAPDRGALDAGHIG